MTNDAGKKQDTILKYDPVFKRAGFDDYSIDFSDVSAEAIEAMGEALLKLEWLQATRVLAQRNAERPRGCCPQCGTPIDGTDPETWSPGELLGLCPNGCANR